MLKYPLFVWLITMSLFLSLDTRASEQPLFIGTNAEQQGIFASILDLATGEFGPSQAVGDAPRPGFLTLHPWLPILYSISREKEQRPSGGLRSFRIETGAQALTLLNCQTTGDEGTTHLALDPAAKVIVVANYTGGSTSLLPLTDEGTLEPFTSLVKHKGSGVHTARQGEPHAHGVAMDTSGRFACVADLGTDEVIVFRLLTEENSERKLERHSTWKAKPGAGPRHLAFHPKEPWLYSINELNATLTVLTFNDQTGVLTETQTIGTLPADYDEPNTTAEVVVHPNGRFVYCSNRGHDSTAVFAIDVNTGRLTLIQIEPTRGGHPRFIGIEPSGKYLIAANRDANNLVSFQIDPVTGKLTPTGHEISIPQPVCVVFPRKSP